MQCVPEVPFSEPGPELHGHCPVPGGSTSEYQGCMQSLCILIFTTNKFIKGKKKSTWYPLWKYTKNSTNIIVRECKTNY